MICFLWFATTVFYWNIGFGIFFVFLIFLAKRGVKKNGFSDSLHGDLARFLLKRKNIILITLEILLMFEFNDLTCDYFQFLLPSFFLIFISDFFKIISDNLTGNLSRRTKKFHILFKILTLIIVSITVYTIIYDYDLCRSEYSRKLINYSKHYQRYMFTPNLFLAEKGIKSQLKIHILGFWDLSVEGIYSILETLFYFLSYQTDYWTISRWLFKSFGFYLSEVIVALYGFLLAFFILVKPVDVIVHYITGNQLPTRQA